MSRQDDEVPNAHKNLTLQPRQLDRGKFQPVDKAIQDQMRTALVTQVPVSVTDINNPPPQHTKQFPDAEDMWNLIPAGQAISAPLAPEPAPVRIGKGSRKGKKADEPVVTSSQATGMQAGRAQVATEVMPNVATYVTGEPLVHPTGQPSAVQPTPQVYHQPQPQPPKTRLEYMQQQMQANGQMPYPDVADVFSGKVPGEIPINRLPQQAPPLPVQRIVQEVTINHELPNDARAYQATTQFTMYMDGVSHTFMRGQMIYDVNIIDYLLMTNNQNIAPASELEQWLTCPACKHNFPPEAGHKATQSHSGSTDYEAFARGTGLRPRVR